MDRGEGDARNREPAPSPSHAERVSVAKVECDAFQLVVATVWEHDWDLVTGALQRVEGADKDAIASLGVHAVAIAIDDVGQPCIVVHQQADVAEVHRAESDIERVVLSGSAYDLVGEADIAIRRGVLGVFGFACAASRPSSPIVERLSGVICEPTSLSSTAIGDANATGSERHGSCHTPKVLDRIAASPVFTGEQSDTPQVWPTRRPT